MSQEGRDALQNMYQAGVARRAFPPSKKNELVQAYNPICWGLSNRSFPIPPDVLMQRWKEQGGWPKRSPEWSKQRQASYVVMDSECMSSDELRCDIDDVKVVGCARLPDNVCQLQYTGLEEKVRMTKTGLNVYVDHMTKKEARSASVLFEVQVVRGGHALASIFGLLVGVSYKPKYQNYVDCKVTHPLCSPATLNPPFDLEISHGFSRLSQHFVTIAHSTSHELSAQLARLATQHDDSIILHKLIYDIGDGLHQMHVNGRHDPFVLFAEGMTQHARLASERETTGPRVPAGDPLDAGRLAASRGQGHPRGRGRGRGRGGGGARGRGQGRGQGVAARHAMLEDIPVVGEAVIALENMLAVDEAMGMEFEDMDEDDVFLRQDRAPKIIIQTS